MRYGIFQAPREHVWFSNGKAPITQSDHDLDHGSEIEKTEDWDVRTIVLRIDRSKPKVDTAAHMT